MAITTDAWYQNSIPGVPQVGADVDLREMTAKPKYALGHKIELSDGRVFRYGHFGADVTQGKFVAQDISESGKASGAGVTAPASAKTTTDGTTGSYFVEIASYSTTANQFAGGYLAITDDTGEGYTYRIIGNTVSGNPGTGLARIQLFEPLVKALDATTEYAVMGSKYQNLESATIATDNILAGVTVRSMDVSEAPYGWVQTKGPITVTMSEEAGSTGAIGDAVAVDTALNACKKWGAPGTGLTTSMIAEPRVGTILVLGTGQALIDLEIE